MNGRDQILLEKISSALEKIDSKESQSKEGSAASSVPVSISQRQVFMRESEQFTPHNSPQKMAHSVLFRQAHRAQEIFEKIANQLGSGSLKS